MNDWLTVELSGIAMILLILIIRSLFVQKITKNAVRLSWYIPMTMMLVPYRIPSQYSFGQLIKKMLPVRAERIMIFNVEDPSIGQLVEKMHHGLGGSSWWHVIWIVGCIGCLSYFLAVFIRCWKEFSTSLPIEEPNVIKVLKAWENTSKQRRQFTVRKLDTIRSPLTYRIHCPVILLPSKMIEEDYEKGLQYVLEHEYQHIAKYDEVVKLLLVLCACVHWFNPYVWVMLFVANEDIELACDERVMRKIGYDHNKEYATTLINFEANKSSVAFYNNFSTNDLEDRIQAISKQIHVTYPWIILISGLIVVSTVLLNVSVTGSNPGINLWMDNYSNWVINNALSRSMFEYRNGTWKQYGGLTVVVPREDNSYEQWILQNDEAEEYPTENHVWQKELPYPTEGARVLYDNWGEPEEIFIPNGDGTYSRAMHTWIQIS